MNVVPFEWSKHADTISSWHIARGMSGYTPAMIGHPDCYPPTGLVTPTIAMWLYFTDGPQVFMEHTISDPAASREERAEDAKDLLQAVGELVASRGYRTAVTFSPIASASGHLEHYGFRETDPSQQYRFFAKVVRGEPCPQ